MPWFCNNWICRYPPRLTPHCTQVMVPHWRPGSATNESVLPTRLPPHCTQAMVPYWCPGSATTESVDIPQTYPTLHTGNGPLLMLWFCNNWICRYPPDLPHTAHRQWSPIDTLVLQQLNLQLSPRLTPHRTQAMVPYWCPGSATTESAVIPQTYPTSHTGNGPHWYPGSATTESVDISQTYPTLHTGNGPPLTPWFCNNWICSYPPDLPHIAHRQWSPTDALVLQQLNL